MCVGFNFLAVKEDISPYCDDLNSGHEELIKQRKLKDVGLMNRVFVRIEVLPLQTLTSSVPEDWLFKIDETGTLPSWFDEDEWKVRCLRKVVSIALEIAETKKFKGSLDLRGAQITELPQGLSVGGSLDLRGTQITELPQGLSVGSSLYLRGTQINREKIPQSLRKRCIF